MVHAKPEWDITSMTPSSSPASPKRHAYFVQSPRDSHDYAYKSSSASAPTPPPAYSSSSPMDSPSHPSTYYGRSSNPRSSSASRVSGNWSSARLHRKKVPKDWQECSVIKEEIDFDLMYGDEGSEGGSTYLMAVLGVALVFAAFSLIIWGASRPYNTHIIMQSWRVHHFILGEGTDGTGVPTKMITVNCTATMSIHNPATFYGIYVSSNPVDLFYSEIPVATGELRKYFQPRKSFRVISVNLNGYQVPLYGAGATVAGSSNRREVPLKLEFVVQSWGYLVGSLVKTEHHRHISCTLVIPSERPNERVFQQDSCVYGRIHHQNRHRT